MLSHNGANFWKEEQSAAPGHAVSMADPTDLNLDAPSDLQDIPDLSPVDDLVPPPEGTYPDKASLIASVHAHAKAHGYNVVVKSSSTPTEKKPGRTAKVWLRCDRGGQYRPRNGLTEETRKRKRTSRLMDCPFMLVAAGNPGIWTLTWINPRQDASPPCQKGPGYCWSPMTGLMMLLFPLHHGSGSRGTCKRDGRDLSTLSTRENFRSHNNPTATGIGSTGPLGRFLIRGEPGNDIVPDLYPLDGEPVIDKPGRGAFAHTDFELLLRNKGIKNLVVVGMTTDGAVASTLREGCDKGFDCLLLEDGAVALDHTLHIGACNSVKMEGGLLGATSRIDDLVHAVDNFKNLLVKKMAPQMMVS
ncbi:isochorismatase family hydrolase [Trichophyton tonsurans CBS 112818]|uniref:Isochorismatase family hydrolase n=1 Tax=Trichophyton tonsurans (strain CBS 112818) TaxID=647933 RepID=F2RQG5_TRIT1|nr:isochorismatase family hydrolase [Trichophyton tonsurans CBS 112818]